MFALFPAESNPEATVFEIAGEELRTSFPTITGFEFPKKVPMDWDISAINSRLKSLPGMPLIPFVPKNFRGAAGKIASRFCFPAVYKFRSLVILINFLVAEAAAVLAPEPALVFARELGAAGPASKMTRLDVCHFVVADRTGDRFLCPTRGIQNLHISCIDLFAFRPYFFLCIHNLARIERREI